MTGVAFAPMSLIRASVRSILEHADAYAWSIQGFGMLRCYLTKEVRLHVWDSSFAVRCVSTIHDHPWDFTSLIVSGAVKQYRFTEVHPRTGAPEYRRQVIRCGTDGGLADGCSMDAPASCTRSAPTRSTSRCQVTS